MLYGETQEISVLKVAIHICDAILEALGPRARDGQVVAKRFYLELEYYRRTGEPDARDGASALAREACILLTEVNPAWVANISEAWGRWKLQEGDWELALEAFSFGLGTLDLLQDVQIDRWDVMQRLRDAQGLHVHASYALAKLGRYDEAVEAMESGAARMNARAPHFCEAELEAAREKCPDLADRFSDAMRSYREFEQREKSTQSLSAETMYHLRELAIRIQATVHEIRAEGFPQFLRSIKLPVIQTVAHPNPLIYVGASQTGGLALIADGAAVRCVWLDEFSEFAVESKIGNDLPKHVAIPIRDDLSPLMVDGRLNASDLGRSASMWQAYEEWRTAASAETLKKWVDKLGGLCEWLWKPLSRIFETISGEEVVLIPVGILAATPLHAAVSPDGREALLHRVAIRYAPNARSLRGRSSMTEVVSEDRFFGASISSPTLPEANTEIQAALAFFPPQRRQSYFGRAATVDALLAVLPGANVFHVATHAVADLVDPLDSAISLSEGTRLAGTQLLLHDLRHLRLAILSGCETAFASRFLPDEMASLATVFLEAGAAGAIASGWRATDQSCMLTMVRFYYNWRANNLTPAQALRHAQIWMKDTSNDQKKIDLLQMGQCTAAEDGYMRAINAAYLVVASRGDRGFDHPRFWATFAYIGS